MNFKLIAFVLALLLLSFPSIAQAPARPHVIVILADALRFDDINNPQCAVLKEMAGRGSIGMMNCAVAGKKSGSAALLTLAAGTHVAAESSDALAFNDWESVPGENGEARMAYMRRVGPLDPNAPQFSPDIDRSVKHLGIAGLARRRLEADRLGAILAGAKEPVSTWVCGNADTYTPDRSAALLTVDEHGIGAGLVSLLRYDNSTSFGLVDDPIAMLQAATEANRQFSFIVVQTGDLSRLESARPYLSDQQFQARRDAALRRLSTLVNGLNGTALASGADLLLVSPRPIANQARKGDWDRLTPIIAIGPDFPPGQLTSPTTRTQGLVANIDFAPTILNLFHVPIPAETSITGRAMRTTASQSDEESSNRIAAVARLDFVSGMNEAATVRVLVPLLFVCFSIVAGGLLARRSGTKYSHWFAPGFVFTLNVPAAMLFAPILVPPTLWEYGLRIVGWGIGLSMLCYLAAYRWRISPALSAMALTVLILAVDTLTGQALQKDSLFSLYAVSGIRYYGIGNEYLGVLVAFSLLSVFCRLEDRKDATGAAPAGNLNRVTSLIWAAIALMCGWPGLGANAGSLTVTAAAFGVGLVVLRGKKPSFRIAGLFTLTGLLLAFLFGALDAAFGGAHVSHSGAAIAAASGSRGPGYLLEIAVRKIWLNLHYLGTPAVLGGLAAIAAVLWIANLVVGKALRQLFSKRTWLVRSLYPLAAGGAAAVLFKDSGVVTFAFMAGSAATVFLYYVITDGSESGSDAAS